MRNDASFQYEASPRPELENLSEADPVVTLRADSECTASAILAVNRCISETSTHSSASQKLFMHHSGSLIASMTTCFEPRKSSSMGVSAFLT